MQSSILDKITNEAKQNIQFVLSNGETIDLFVYYSIITGYWFMNIKYKEFVLYGLQMVFSDNLLIQYENVLPFGIQITSITGLSPISLDSFSNQYNQVIINEF